MLGSMERVAVSRVGCRVARAWADGDPTHPIHPIALALGSMERMVVSRVGRVGRVESQAAQES